jgi:hypothetical protein
MDDISESQTVDDWAGVGTGLEMLRGKATITTIDDEEYMARMGPGACVEYAILSQ